MSAPLSLVIFDVDGTLVDSQEVIVASMLAAFDGLGRKAPLRGAILDIVGLSLPIAMGRLAPGARAAEIEALCEGYKAAFIAARARGEAEVPLFTGAMAAIEALHAQPETLLGVATGKSRRGLEATLKTHDLGRLFVTSQTADDHPSKPHPAMIQACLAETGVDPARAVIVGDTSYDIDMGRAAGIRTIGVSWGYHSAQSLVAAGADLVIEEFGALIGAVDGLWGQV